MLNRGTSYMDIESLLRASAENMAASVAAPSALTPVQSPHAREDEQIA